MQTFCSRLTINPGISHIMDEFAPEPLCCPSALPAPKDTVPRQSLAKRFLMNEELFATPAAWACLYPETTKAASTYKLDDDLLLFVGHVKISETKYAVHLGLFVNTALVHAWISCEQYETTFKMASIIRYLGRDDKPGWAVVVQGQNYTRYVLPVSMMQDVETKTAFSGPRITSSMKFADMDVMSVERVVFQQQVVPVRVATFEKDPRAPQDILADDAVHGCKGKRAIVEAVIAGFINICKMYDDKPSYTESVLRQYAQTFSNINI